MRKTDTILVTGSSGLVGSALMQYLRRAGYENVVGCRSSECDLSDFSATQAYFMKHRPKYVFHIAGHVYGIMGNMKNQGLSYLKNTLINTHVVEASRMVNVEKIAAMGSGCVYPYPSPGLPLKEDMIWSGRPHHSEEAYAHSKRAMLAQLEAYADSYGMKYAFVISGNLYGPNDKFDSEFGHVTPSLIRKFYEAKQAGSDVVVWGDGSARRDFLFVEDVAEALHRIMLQVEGAVNMGSSRVNSIKDIVDFLAEYTGMQERVKWDSTKPNGQDYRAYDLTKLMSTGFEAQYSLADGLRITYDWYAENHSSARR